jgi:Protein of unknown function (DUF1501)
MQIPTPSKGIGSNRREFLKSTAMAVGGAALPSLWLSSAGGVTSLPSRNKSVLFVFLGGGPSQLDMYDLKPDAPAAIRGEFRPINTNVPGMRVCEHLPLHAKIADKFAIVNGVETIDNHGPDVQITGYLYNAERQRPNLTQIASQVERGKYFGDCLDDIPDQAAARPFLDQLQNSLQHGSGITLLETRSLPHDNPWGNWDCHGKVLGSQLSIFGQLRDKLPVYDAALHGLISGLYDRGLDQDVLVVVCGEFGRTPWINKYGGRDHWAPSGSVLFAGGGLKMGQAIGDTGPIGERERSRSKPYTAQNVLATIYRHLGIDPAMTVRDGHGRIMPLLDDASPIKELI